ncbi:homologous recombination OB-fold protein-like [Macrobrachium rosenbergii]|uniref:homologous recombination OB-fold protein-like n=1 Tax=Macrobrachium rosenbergii TaxID=79674 RepID=UPI0034D77AA1
MLGITVRFFTPLKSDKHHEKNLYLQGSSYTEKISWTCRSLPQLVGGFRTAHMSVQPLCEEDNSPSVSKDIVCSQSSADEFLCGPWQQMLEDLELNQPNQASPLTVFNIKWILRRAALRGYAGVRKIPFLAVMVRSVDASLSDATVLLRDKTGEMNGTISNSVLEERIYRNHYSWMCIVEECDMPFSSKP